MRSFFVNTVGLIILILIISMGINYYLDPYGVFFKEYRNYITSSPINERYIKTKYILDNPKKYNSFIFGSSRVGTLEGENLKDIGNFYNMTFSGAVPKQILEILKIFIDNKIEIKNIILGIDDFDFYSEPEISDYYPYKISYKVLNNKINFLKYYLLKNPINRVNIEYIFGKAKVEFDILDTGKWSSVYKENLVENNLENHRKELKNKKVMSASSNRILQTIEDINEILSICRENNINIEVIYLPLYEKTYCANESLIEKSKEELLKITNFWDFAVLDKYTTDEYYWYEESHYRPILGRKIFKRIYNKKFTRNEEIDKNFGKYQRKKLQ